MNKSKVLFTKVSSHRLSTLPWAMKINGIPKKHKMVKTGSKYQVGPGNCKWVKSLGVPQGYINIKSYSA